MAKDDFTELAQQQKKGRTRILLLIGLLLVVGSGLLAWQVFARQTPQTSSISNNSHFSAQSSPPASKGTVSVCILLMRWTIGSRWIVLVVLLNNLWSRLLSYRGGLRVAQFSLERYNQSDISESNG